jgi:RimJ/RimL family protein N-acetyltransferase
MTLRLTTERLVLRPFTQHDAPALLAAKQASLPELRAWLPWAQREPSLATEEETIRHFQQKWLRDEECTLGLFCSNTEGLLGCSGFMVRDRAVPAFEIGYWLDTRQVGKGYMHEAVRALTQHLLGQEQALRVMIRCVVGNDASRKVAERLGFPLEGVLRNKRRHLNGVVVDECSYAHTPETWVKV